MCICVCACVSVCLCVCVSVCVCARYIDAGFMRIPDNVHSTRANTIYVGDIDEEPEG